MKSLSKITVAQLLKFYNDTFFLKKPILLFKLKKYLIKSFQNFLFFYHYLKYRIFIIILISIIVGLLDGLGLSMFLPLLQLVSDNAQIEPKSLGNLSFLVIALNNMGIDLNLFSVLLIMTLFFILKGVAVFYQSYYQVLVQLYFSRKIRVENILGINKLSYSYFTQADIGQIQNTLTGEVDRVTQAFGSYFLAFQQFILVLVYMGFAFFIDAQFALLVSLGGFVTNYIFRFAYKKTKTASFQYTLESNRFQGLIIQHVQNFKYLKATGFINDYGNRLILKVDDIQDAAKRIGVLSSLLKGMREPLLIIIVSIVILVQTKLLNSPLGPILISLLFFYRALVGVLGAQTAWNYFIANLGSINNITNFFKLLEKNKEKPSLKDKIGFVSDIVLKDISVLYGKAVILNSINLKIEKNSTVAFVGESGSGKTTLINVLTGLLNPASGEILIDNISYTNLNIMSFRKKIGYITQEPVIFNDTIFNNVTLWSEKSEANLNRFNIAIKNASLFEFIHSLQMEEETMLGNNGVNLSGGQRQRVSIARELYKEIEILILDEATSALDSETEREIQKNIDLLKGKYTILIIAHRLSTIKNADLIFLLKNGSIMDSGSFENLLNNVPTFKDIVASQKL